ncbi:MAG TPA: hypothetical protein VIL46_06540 [Gemmataceae bacterium]
MRTGIVLGLFLAAAGGAFAQGQEEPQPRYGVNPILANYPQGTPKETLGSVLKALDRGRVEYVLAHLLDPAFVDDRVRATGGRFEDVVAEVKQKLDEDPETVKEMRRFLKEGETQEQGDQASIILKGTEDRMYFRKIGTRWFMENRRQERKAAERE